MYIARKGRKNENDSSNEFVHRTCMGPTQPSTILNGFVKLCVIKKYHLTKIKNSFSSRMKLIRLVSV